MEFLATKRRKIITSVIFIIFTLYVGLGFDFSFNPINWLSPNKVLAKRAAQNLYDSVEKLKTEENKGNVNSKLARIKTNLEAVHKHIIEYYKQSTSNEYQEIKELYEKIFKSQNDAYKELKSDTETADEAFTKIKNLFQNDDTKYFKEKVNNFTK
jgi:uncharacterized protein YfkK (UPF0435 family)